MRSSPDYEVGYGKPPLATRFAKGRSGNPSGRKKGQSGAAAILEKIFRRKVRLTVEGRSRRVPVTEAVLLQLSNKAMSGEPTAIREYLRLALEWQASSEGPEVISAEQLSDFLDALAIASAFLEMGWFVRSDGGHIKVTDWLMRLAGQHLAAPTGQDGAALWTLNQHYVVGSPDPEP